MAVGISQSTPLDTTMRVASLAGWLAAPFALGALACFAMAVRRARDRRHALEAVGLALILTGVAHFALLSVGVNLAASLGGEMRQRTALRVCLERHAPDQRAGQGRDHDRRRCWPSPRPRPAPATWDAPGGPRRTGPLAALARPSWRAVACLVAVAAGYFAMRWPEATTAIVMRILAFTAFLVGAIGLLDVMGSVHWVPGGPARSIGRSPPGIGGDGSDRVRQHRHAVRRPGLRPRPAGAERGPRRHGRGRLQRPCRAVRPATRRGRARWLAQLHPPSSQDGYLFARHRGGIGAQLASGVRLSSSTSTTARGPGPRAHRLPQRVRGGARQRPR